MSENSPVLLNMGADLSTAAGSSIGTRPIATGENSGGFATVLQSAMQPAIQNMEKSGILNSELASNPVLMTDMDGAMEHGLTPGLSELIELSGGKTLPSDEQTLAWEGMFAEYDSENPETPKMVLAYGDNEGYQLEEFTADDLLPQSSDIHQGNYQNDSENQPESLARQQIDIEAEQNREQVTDESVAITVSHPDDKSGQASLVKPTVESVNRSDPSSLSSLDKTAGINQTSHKIDPADQEPVKASVEENMDVALNSKQETGKENSFKSELNSMIENSANRANQSANNTFNNASQNSVTGASTYAAISGLNPSAPSQPSSQVVGNMTIPPSNPAWGDIVGDRVQWMVNQNISEAKIRLNPPELGFLEVKVQLGNDQLTSISFSSPHSQVRDALESAVPRLREMFGESGLSLGDVDVSHHSMSERDQAGQENNSEQLSTSIRADASSGQVGNEMITQHLSTGTGMLDLYA